MDNRLANQYQGQVKPMGLRIRNQSFIGEFVWIVIALASDLANMRLYARAYFTQSIRLQLTKDKSLSEHL